MSGSGGIPESPKSLDFFGSEALLGEVVENRPTLGVALILSYGGPQAGARHTEAHSD